MHCDHLYSIVWAPMVMHDFDSVQQPGRLMDLFPLTLLMGPVSASTLRWRMYEEVCSQQPGRFAGLGL